LTYLDYKKVKKQNAWAKKKEKEEEERSLIK
jgi:hypothetical protein